MIKKYNWNLDDWKKWCDVPLIEQYKYCLVVAFQENADVISISLLKSDSKNVNKLCCLANKSLDLKRIVQKGPEFCKKFFDNELDKMEIELNFKGYY